MVNQQKIGRIEVSPILDNNRATFLFHGADQPYLVGDFNFWNWSSGLPFTRFADGTWRLTLDFPADTYMEYALLVKGSREVDPLNPRRLNSGTGDINNWFYMPSGGPHPLSRRTRLQGNLTKHLVTDDVYLLNGKRSIYFYQPAAPGPYPLLVVYDGADYLYRGRLPSIVDQLIAAGKIQPLALALVPNAGKARFAEYACGDAIPMFVERRVLPLAYQALSLVDIQRHPGSFGVLGASMGGMMALHTALSKPQIFGKVLCQAGAFQMYGEDFSILERVKNIPPVDLRIWLDVGKFDFLNTVNHRMQALFLEKKIRVTFREINGGHNYTTWRNDLPYGLEELFPAIISK